MSTLTQAQPGTAGPARLLSVPLAVTFLAEFTSLTAELLPPERRGEGLGLLGIVSGVPAIIALPAGVWLAGHHLAAAAAAMAATAGLLPLAAIRWLPGGHETRRTDRAGQNAGRP